jgi:hypothetical protein
MISDLEAAFGREIDELVEEAELRPHRPADASDCR